MRFVSSNSDEVTNKKSNFEVTDSLKTSSLKKTNQNHPSEVQPNGMDTASIGGIFVCLLLISNSNSLYSYHMIA